MDVIRNTLVYEGIEPKDGEVYSIDSMKRKNRKVICKLIKEIDDSPVYLLNQPSTDVPFEIIWNKKHQSNKQVKLVSVCVYAKILNGRLCISFKKKAPKNDNK